MGRGCGCIRLCWLGGCIGVSLVTLAVIKIDIKLYTPFLGSWSSPITVYGRVLFTASLILSDNVFPGIYLEAAFPQGFVILSFSMSLVCRALQVLHGLKGTL